MGGSIGPQISGFRCTVWLDKPIFGDFGMSHQLHPVTMFSYVPHVVHESILLVQMMFI